MKKIILGFFVIIGLFSNIAYAASDDECGIILCVPAGFGSGCEPPHRAMMKRIHSFKSPVPPLSECLNKDEKKLPVDTIVSDGEAAIFPQTKRCINVSFYGDHGEKCLEYIDIPRHYIMNAKKGYNPILYIDVKVENKQQGNPFFIGRNAQNVAQLPYSNYSQYLSLYAVSKNHYAPNALERANIKKYVELVKNSRVADLWIDE